MITINEIRAEAEKWSNNDAVADANFNSFLAGALWMHEQFYGRKQEAK